MVEAGRDVSAPAWLESVLKFLLQAWTIHRGTPHGKVALMLVTGGIAIITRSWIEAVASAAWQATFDKPITFPEIHPLYGIFLILSGIGLLVWTAWDKQRSATMKVRPTVATIRHDSMEAVTIPLQWSALPANLANAYIRPFDIDQTAFYKNGVLSAAGAGAAVQMQTDLVTGVRSLVADKPDAEVVYYGKAHIPLVFLAGHNLSIGRPIRFYELDRQRGDWWAIDETASGDELGLRLARTDENKNNPAVAIRISLSYQVHSSDVADVFGKSYRDVHISIAEPHVDSVRTRHQIEAIAKMFRTVLDELKAEEPEPTGIHVFYSGPMSVAFCLGRQISPTIHSPVFVYNFTAKTTPKYAWALQVNGQGPAESLIVSTPLPAN